MRETNLMFIARLRREMLRDLHAAGTCQTCDAVRTSGLSQETREHE